MKTRILFLISRFLDGGIDTVMLEYLKNFNDKEFELTLAIGTKMDELEVFLDRIPSKVRVVYLVSNSHLTKYRKEKVTHKLPLCKKIWNEVILTPLHRLQMQYNLDKLTIKNDLVIDFDCSYGSFLKKTKIAKIAFFHFSFASILQNRPNRIKRLTKKLKVYDQIITISTQMQKEGESIFPQLKERFTCIYNSFEREYLKKKAAEKPSNAYINESYLLAVERLEESQKDLTTLLKAFAILKKKHHITEKLYLLGEGKSQNQLMQLAINLGIEKDTVFLGFQPNPYPWIANCQILVHSSKFEGLPTVLIEGLLLGKLIVSTDCPTGPREILKNGEAGILTPVGDFNALADAIYNLKESEKLRTQILATAAVHSEIFSCERNMQKIEELCQKLAHEKKYQ